MSGVSIVVAQGGDAELKVTLAIRDTPDHMAGMKLTLLSAHDKLAEIKRLYYETTRHTINADLAKALDLLKSLSTEEDRERAAVYMDGLSQMRSEWKQGGGTKKKPTRHTDR